MQDPDIARPPLRWRLLGAFSGVGPGLFVAGIARLVGELLGSAVGVAAGAIAVGVVAALLIWLAVILAFVSRGGRPGGLSSRNAPAVAAFALTALGVAVILPGSIAAILAIGLGVLVRIGVALAIGLARESQVRPS